MGKAERFGDMKKASAMVFKKREINFLYDKIDQNGKERKIESEELLALSCKSAMRHLSS